MATIDEVCAAVADILKNEINDRQLRVTDYVPDSIAPPCAFVNLGEITERDFDGSLSVTLDAVILVARGAAPRIGQRSLYSLYKPLRAAVDGNEDLGMNDGTVARVMRYRPLSIEEIAAVNCYGGAYELEIVTSGE